MAESGPVNPVQHWFIAAASVASAKLAELLRNPRVRSRTDDDCTILQAELRPAAEEAVP